MFYLLKKIQISIKKYVRNRFSVTFNHSLNRATEEENNKLLSFPLEFGLFHSHDSFLCLVLVIRELGSSYSRESFPLKFLSSEIFPRIHPQNHFGQI